METTGRHVAEQLKAALLQRFGERAFSLDALDGKPQSASQSIVAVFRRPGRTGHTLRVVHREEAFQVEYEDGLPPGPAEALFSFSGPNEARRAARDVIEFLESIFEGRVVMWRERLGRITRTLRRQDCESLLWFARPNELSPKRSRKMVTKYEWANDADAT